MRRVLSLLGVLALAVATLAPASSGASSDPVPIFEHFAGDGGDVDDGEHRLDAGFPLPIGIDLAPDGSLIVANSGFGRIRRIAPDGTVSTLHDANAGVSGVAVDSNGDVYFTVPSDRVVRRMDAAGNSVVIVAGTGEDGDEGDGGPAIDAKIRWPTALSIDPVGRRLYVTDVHSERVREIRLDTGDIFAFAGNGFCQFNGDGIAAVSAGLCDPDGTAVAPDGSVYIADTSNRRVRRVVNGTISTVAGSGNVGPIGDGGPATDAGLVSPAAVAVSPRGEVFISDGGGNRIRVVDSLGTIRTYAGNSDPGTGGVGGPATSAAVGYPLGLALDPTGNLFVSQYSTARIGVVRPAAFFADVGAGHQFFEAIQWMWASGASNGSPSPVGSRPEYRPTAVVRRQAMAAFLYRLAGSPAVGAAPFFADVGPSHPFFDAINWMGETGVSTGYPDPDGGKPEFGPADAVKRQAMAAFLHRLYGPPLIGVGETFADVGASHPFFFEIEWMGQAGISTGSPNPAGGSPLYVPGAPVLRQAMAAFLFRIEVAPA